MMKRITELSLYLIAPVLLSCDAFQQRKAEHTTVDSAGVRIVESSAPSWGLDPLRIEQDPVIRIGQEEPGPYQFAFVSAGRLLDDGRIIVADVGAQEVRVFSPSGEHLITLGREGQGPGEFSGLAGVFEYPGDSIAAFDGRLYRTTIFSIATGGHRTIQNQAPGNYAVFGHVRDGPFLLYSAGGGFRPDLEPGAQWVSTDVVAMDSFDGTSRVIGNLPDRWRVVGSDGNAPMPQPLMYASQAVAREGFYWGTPDQYELTFYDEDGRARRIIRRQVEARVVDDALITEFIDGQLARIRASQGEAAASQMQTRLREDQYGDHVPLFQEVFVDGEERLWVGASEWPAMQSPKRWSVFAQEGYWLGDVVAPEGLRVVDADRDLVLGIWRDELDVPHVQLHRLPGAPSGE